MNAARGKPRGIGSVAGHVRRDGTAKVAYEEVDAKAEAAALGQVAYQCSLCGRWHLATNKSHK